MKLSQNSKQQQPMEGNEMLYKSLTGLLTSTNRKSSFSRLDMRTRHPTSKSLVSICTI
ncbi:hypothetical protein Scep_003844 [Stephania cephalantha]|uniref:Uncharacterized protein n=1 Tax=Stephania cephalantha TaxID=152367 RepID=A0AAP0PW50_9MAGN